MRSRGAPPRLPKQPPITGNKAFDTKTPPFRLPGPKPRTAPKLPKLPPIKDKKGFDLDQAPVKLPGKGPDGKAKRLPLPIPSKGSVKKPSGEMRRLPLPIKRKPRRGGRAEGTAEARQYPSKPRLRKKAKIKGSEY